MRCDLALVERGLARSRNHAAELIRAGRVRTGGRPVLRPATQLDDHAELEVDDDGYVSRAAYKLLGALDATGLEVPARCLDAGSSTGGFTQVLLERGAERVYAVDVGTGQLAPLLREDPRVVVHEQTNLRELRTEHVDDRPVDLVVADVSFISLTLLLEPMLAVLDDGGAALLMVKPQFEVGRAGLGKGGVVRDPARRQAAVDGVVRAAAELGWRLTATAPSPLPGPAGNVEYFVLLQRVPDRVKW